MTRRYSKATPIAGYLVRHREGDGSRQNLSLPRTGRSRRKAGPFLRLSYIIGRCHADAMARESKWKSRAIALEYWLLSALVAGSFVVGLAAAIRYLSDG